ncbi:hypothetical protein ACVOMT_11085 [Sphingomonas panni]
MATRAGVRSRSRSGRCRQRAGSPLTCPSIPRPRARSSTSAPSGATTIDRTPYTRWRLAPSVVPETWLPPTCAVVKGMTTVSTTGSSSR